MNKSKKDQNFNKTIKATKYMFIYVWKEKHGKTYVFIKGIMAVLNALFPLVFTIVPGLIINELINNSRLNILILYVGILTIFPIISQLLNVISNKKITKLSLNLNLKFETDFYDHIASMDYETIENPEIQTLKGRAGETLSGSLSIVDQLSALLSSIFGLIAISSIIITLNPLIIILIIVLIYLNSLVTKWLNKKQFTTRKEISNYSRYEWGLTYMLDNFHYAKEVRLFGIKRFLIQKLIDNKTEANKLHIKDSFDKDKANSFYAITNFVQQLVLYTYLIYKVIFSKFPIGNMTIVLSATGQFSSALSTVMNSYLKLTDNSLKIQELIDFMEIPLKQHETGSKEPHFDCDSVIEFKNVSFKYPGSSNYALKNLNLKIKGDEKLCIVGVNGSGKSTFIKLLTRLYFPSEGEILLNGININEYDYKKYQRLFSPVFQDFARYYMTLKENIVLASDFDRDLLDKVCSECGLSSLVSKLPKNYDTQVDKWIDEEGFEPSGGEDQRIAIARACYHGGEVFLLDEPTAALDPVAEYEIYTQFNNMITDKCAVLITHRLSAVQLADKIAVFKDGSVVEYGTHKELYDNNDIYTEMFNKQAEFYRKDVW